MYADDTILVASTYEKLVEAVRIVELFCAENLIQLNGAKSEYTIFNPQYTESVAGTNFTKAELLHERMSIKVGNVPLYISDHIKYLGTYLSQKLNNSKHIEHRKALTVRALARAKSQWLDSPCLPYDMKSFLYNTYVRPVLWYGLEFLNLTKKEEKSISSFDHILLKNVYKLP